MATKKVPTKKAHPSNIPAVDSERVKRLGQLPAVVNAAALRNGMTAEEIAARLLAAGDAMGVE